tara:strand:+ start:1118 stop:1621 length:504 start_codon:yes stop_codon:yes gene_type:complete
VAQNETLYIPFLTKVARIEPKSLAQNEPKYPNVDNSVALKTAEAFYNTLFDKTILEALQDAMVHSENTKDQNIYIMYGLHFTKLKKGSSIENSKNEVTIGLLRSLETWKGNLSRSNDHSIKENIQDLINWNVALILKKYREELLEIVGKDKVIEIFKKHLRQKKKIK